MLKYIKNKNIKKRTAPVLFFSTLVLAANCGNSKPSSSKNLKEANPAPIATGKSNTTHVIPPLPPSCSRKNTGKKVTFNVNLEEHFCPTFVRKERN